MHPSQASQKPEKPTLRIVFFTNKLPHGAEILKAFHTHHIELQAIFLEDTGLKDYFKQIRGYYRKLGLVDTFRMVSSMAVDRYIRNYNLIGRKFYEGYCETVIGVKNFNSPDCEARLRALEPDILILGGSRIIRNNIISVPKLCVLNVHPGLLPKYRGVDPIPWAIHNGDPVGVTLHVVDAGVDTGPILAQQVIDIQPGDTLGTLQKKSEIIAGELMVAGIRKIMETGRVEGQIQAREAGQQFYKMPRDLFNKINRQLKES